MKNKKFYWQLAFVLLFLGVGIHTGMAQDKLLSVEFPNGTTGISGEVVDAKTGYKLTYYNMQYLENKDDKSYYQFHSQHGSFVKIEAPAGEYFEQGDEIRIDTYVNRSSSDSKTISVYDRVDYANGALVGTAVAPGSVVAVYSIVLDSRLPDNTNVLYMPATSSINSYINIHGVEAYGDRGNKAKLATLTVGGTANLDGYKVSYTVDAAAAETSVAISYTKESGKDVTLAISAVQTTSLDNPGELSNWTSGVPASVAIPMIPGDSYYYYIRSSLAAHETVYYEVKITRRNTEDVVYNYDLTVNPINSVEDPALSNIINTSGYHSGHGWRFNYGAGNTLQVKVTGDAIIKLRGCGYNDEKSTIVATVNNETVGDIVPAYQVTAVKDCAGYNNFYYAGEANTITFTYPDVAFLSYITIINEGTAEADLRAIFVGENELSLSDFNNNEYTLTNIGYIVNPENKESFPNVNFAMKKGVTAPIANGMLNAANHLYTYVFEFEGTTYKVHIPYESEVGYTENEVEQRYDIGTAYGLKTVTDMINKGTAIYKTIYLPNGIYDLGDIDGSYQHGITLSAPNVILLGESLDARITGKYRGVTSSVVEIKGANTVVRNLTIENLVGDNGVAPALSTDGDNLLFDKVQLISWQDTYVGGGAPHLFHECIIVGSVDFICNGGAVDYFLRCELQFQYRKSGGYISAPQGKTFFRDCRVTNAPANTTSMSGNFSLARPWNADTGQAFFINTIFDIVPNLGFVTMGGKDFKAGSFGSIGNIKESDGTLLTFNNAPTTPDYTMTEQDIETYSSVYGICGATLAALVSEPVVIPAYQFTTLYVSDALIVPAGVTAYAIVKTNYDYVELGELYAEGGVIPAFTPVVLEAEVDKETMFHFMYAGSGHGASTELNSLSGSLVHQVLSESTVNYYTLDNSNEVTAFTKQGNKVQIAANTAYLTLGSIVTADRLLLKKDIETSITNPTLDEEVVGETTIYDLQGRKVLYPKKGQIYIINGKKRILLD